METSVPTCGGDLARHFFGVTCTDQRVDCVMRPGCCVAHAVLRLLDMLN